ncbi:MAG: carbonic anhydrase, partial [Ottowia sp.]|nr:carbonic anhydrase [Ottowia sp.]
LYRHLREGQRPGCMLIGCSDSRVNPVQLFDCAPGDIFIQRNVANLVPPPGSAGPQGVLAAIEYAVSHLLVSHVVVLGHSNCGGIQALMRRVQGELAVHEGCCGQHLERWIDMAAPVRERILARLPHASDGERCRACEQESILASLDNLRALECVRQRMAEGALQVHGWYFDMDAGELLAWQPQSGCFQSIGRA